MAKNLIPGFDPNRGNNYTLRPDTPATTGSGTTTPPASVDPDASDPSRGFDVGPVHFGFTNRGTPGVSYPGSQAVHDFQNRATNDMSLNLGDPLTAAAGGPNLATLRAQREAVNQRMSTGAKLGADIIGQLNPTQALNLIPGVGPTLQGATQEGIRSAAAGNDPRTIAADTAMGGAGGTAAKVFGSPKALGDTLATGTEIGIPAALGYLTGGEHAVEQGALGAILGSRFFKPAADAVKSAGETVDDWAGPKARQALQNLIMGGASSFIQNNPTPPPMPGWGYPGS